MDWLHARIRISTVLRTDPTRPWSYAAVHALTRLVPIPDSEFAAVEWLHSQPESEKRPKLRTNPTSLCEHWTDEVAKARQFAAAAGVHLPKTEISGQKKNGAAGPEGWRELHAQLWPEAAVPAHFHELAPDLRATLLRETHNTQQQNPQ